MSTFQLVMECGWPFDIYRPDAPGKFPALLALSPYGKDVQTFDTPPQPLGKSVFEASIEAGNPDFFVPRGYVYVLGDLRGTGYSEGEYEGLFSSALVAVGGDGSLQIAHGLAKKGLRVVGVTKTIDNDLDRTMVTFGFDTAVSFATECVARLHATAGPTGASWSSR